MPRSKYARPRRLDHPLRAMTEQPAEPMASLKILTAAKPNGKSVSSCSGLAPRSSPNLPLGVTRGLVRRCPACGVGPLFCGYLTVRPTCPACANENSQYPSDDFAPYVTIFLVLHPILATHRFCRSNLGVVDLDGGRDRFAAVLDHHPTCSTGRERRCDRLCMVARGDTG